MNYRKWLLNTAIVAIAAGGTLTNSVSANQSDVTGWNPANSTGNWSINPPGSGGITINPNGIIISGLPGGFNFSPGIIDLIAGLINDSDVKTAMGTRRATSLDENAELESISLTFNQIAELIYGDLNRALAELAKAEAAAKDGTSGPRRIARRSAVSDEAATICDNSSSTVALTQARQTVKNKLEDSKMFIEQMKLVNPNRNIW